MGRLLLFLLWLNWLVAAQQAKTQAHPISARAKGKALFQQYCASCHGDDGKGAGPAAVAFKVQPPTESRQVSQGPRGSSHSRGSHASPSRLHRHADLGHGVSDPDRRKPGRSENTHPESD
jgi:mono/diheme cytochrome c family protein